MRPWLSWIERQTTNLNVAGSNPAGRTIKEKGFCEEALFYTLYKPFHFYQNNGGLKTARPLLRDLRELQTNELKFISMKQILIR